MADLNALIAQGAQFRQAPDPFVQYGQMQQLEQNRQTNALNQMKMQEMQRTVQEQNALRSLYSTPGMDQASPEFGLAMAKISPTAYQAHLKAVQDQQKSVADITLAKARTLEAGAGTAQKQQQLTESKRNFVRDSLSSLSFNPSDENVKAFGQDAVLMGYLTQEQTDARTQQLLAMPPNERKIYLAQQGMASADTAKLFESKPVDKTDGQTKWVEEGNPRLPNFGQRMTGATPIQMQATPGQVLTKEAADERNRIAKGQLGVSQGQLNIAQQKFAYEQANPGKTIEQIPQADGSIKVVAIDKRTGVATPVMLAGAPGPAMPGQGRPAVGGSGPPLVGASNKGASVSEQNATYNIGRVLTAASQIKDISEKDPSAVQPGMGEAFASSIGMGGTANVSRDANRQIVYGAQRDALDALLYLATGAAYNKEQLEGQMAAYIPAYTDKPEAVTAKRERMAALLQSAKTRAGKAWTPKLDAAMTALIGPVSASGSIRDKADAILSGGK